MAGLPGRSGHGLRHAHQALNQRPAAQGLVQLRSALNGSSGSPAVVQREKGKPLPGRRKRRMAEQQAEIDEMEKANKQWEQTRAKKRVDPTVNPFAALEGVEEETAPTPQQDVVEEETVPTPTQNEVVTTTPTPQPVDLLEGLKRAGDNVQKIREVLTGHYKDQDIGPLSRAWRLNRNAASMAELEKKANAKRLEIERREMDDDSGPSFGGGRLNTTGTVSGLKKGKGGGWLAGTGASWHVHYDHVKFRSDNGSRINFAGRKKADVLNQLALKPNPKGGTDAVHYADCVNWINANL